MKVFKYVMLLTMFLGIIATAETKTKVPEIKTEVLDINGNKNYEVEIPVFIDNVKFKEVNAEINRMMNVNAIREEESEICINDPERCGDYVLEIAPEVVYADTNIISLITGGYSYTGGAHGGSWITPFVVDRKTGKLITEKLKTDNKAVFNKIQKFISDNSVEIFFEEEHTVNELMENAVVYPTGKNTLKILYLAYAVAPYAVGMPEFEYNTKTKKLYFFDGYSGENVSKIEVK